MTFPIKAAAIITALLFTIIAEAKYVAGDKRTFPLYCNGVPCAVDTVNRTIYCSVKPVSGDSIDVMFTSPVFEQASINFRIVKMGDSVRFVNNFSRKHRIYFSGTPTIWYLYFTSLPIVLLDATALVKDVHYPGFITIIDPMRRTDGENSLFIHYAGVKIRGATASTLPKKPFGVELWNENNEEVDVPVMGMRSDGDIILDAMYYDKARMRNRVCFDFWNKVDSIPYAEEGDTKINGTEGTFVEVLLNGEYYGLYCLTDKIDRKKLHLKKYKTDPVSGEVSQRGVLYKATDWSAATRFLGYDTNAATNTLRWFGWEQKYPDDDNSFANWDPLISLITFAAPDLNGNNYKFSLLMGNHFYLQNLVNYVLFLNVFHINDNNCKNTYISFEDIKALHSRALFTPWDMDASIGRNWDGSLLNSYGFDAVVYNCGLFQRLIDDNPGDFRRLIHDTWIRWRSTCFAPDSVEAHINAYRDLFKSSGAYMREMARWSGSLENIDTEAAYMVKWYNNSYAAVNSFLKDYPTGVTDVVSSRGLAITASSGGRRITVDAAADATAEVRIYDTSGMLRESAETTLPYTSGELTRGVYVVSVKTGGTVVRKKVAVQ